MPYINIQLLRHIFHLYGNIALKFNIKPVCDSFLKNTGFEVSTNIICNSCLNPTKVKCNESVCKSCIISICFVFTATSMCQSASFPIEIIYLFIGVVTKYCSGILLDIKLLEESNATDLFNIS